MITVQYAICEGGCGNEVAFFTDGREGVAETCYVEYRNDQVGVTDAGDIWHDGLSVIVSCPTMRNHGDFRCGNEIVFDGDGATISALTHDIRPLGGHEILLEVP